MASGRRAAATTRPMVPAAYCGMVDVPLRVLDVAPPRARYAAAGSAPMGATPVHVW